MNQTKIAIKVNILSFQPNMAIIEAFCPDFNQLISILGLWIIYKDCYICNWKNEQAGTELGQAQLKLGLDFTLIFCRVGFSHLDW